MKEYVEKFNKAINIERIYDTIQTFSTPYQRIDVIKNSNKSDFECAFIDEEIQFSIEDEYLYHESLVHPAMFAHENPKDILLMGGGDGMALREILKHPINSVTMIDLDEAFVTWCKVNKPQWHNNSFLNPKVKIIYGDAIKEIKNFNKQFDIIIIDLVTLLDKDLFEDKVPYSTVNLYDNKFYMNCSQALKNSTGILVTQSHNLGKSDESYKKHKFINNELKKIFSTTSNYGCHVESFCSTTSFVAASDTIDISKLKQKRIDDILKMKDQFKVYEYEYHNHMFYLNKVQRGLLL